MRKTKVSYRKLYKEELQKVEFLKDSIKTLRKIQQTLKRVLLVVTALNILGLFSTLIKYLKV